MLLTVSLPASLSRQEIRKVFARTHGAAAKLAVDLGVSRTTVGLVLRGKVTSARVLAAAEAKALELLAARESKAA